MEARRLAAAAIRKEKKTIVADIKLKVSRLKKGTRTARKKAFMADLKKRMTHFAQKYPHWKKVKTIQSLRRLTISAPAHRLKT